MLRPRRFALMRSRNGVALSDASTAAAKAVPRALAAASRPMRAADASALRQQLRRMATALQLDAGAAIALAQEALQSCLIMSIELEGQDSRVSFTWWQLGGGVKSIKKA